MKIYKEIKVNRIELTEVMTQIESGKWFALFPKGSKVEYILPDKDDNVILIYSYHQLNTN